jgi:hypothetical protein
VESDLVVWRTDQKGLDTVAAQHSEVDNSFECQSVLKIGSEIQYELDIDAGH